MPKFNTTYSKYYTSIMLNMSFRSVEMSRYRLRKKLNLDREVNLTDFLQNF